MKFTLLVLLALLPDFAKAQSRTCNPFYQTRRTLELNRFSAGFSGVIEVDHGSMEPGEQSASLVAYKNWAHMKYPKYTPENDVERYIRFLRGVGVSTVKLELMRDQGLGHLEAMSGIEECLMAQLLGRFDLTVDEVEAAAYVMENRERTLYRVYFQIEKYTATMASLHRVRPQVERDLAQGWGNLLHIHSHPFSTNPTFGDWGGHLMGSDPDLNTYVQDENVVSGRIINGFGTFSINRAEAAILLEGVND